MRASLTFTLLALGVACTRTEEPQSARSAEPVATPAAVASVAAAKPAASATTTAPEPSPSPAPSAALPSAQASAAAAPPPCVVPMPETPLPQQKPAAQCPKDDAEAAPKLALGSVSFDEAKPAVKISVERARLSSEHQRGLMFRTQMPQNHGMIFEWSEESRRVFWMHNTCIPLDMLFIAKDGTVAGILEQVPVLNDAPRTVPCNASYVLEVNAGWCRKHGVRPGMRATIL